MKMRALCYFENVPSDFFHPFPAYKSLPNTIRYVMKDDFRLCILKNAAESSVADPGCLSRIPDPDFYPSRIPDLGSRIQNQVEKRGVKKKNIFL